MQTRRILFTQLHQPMCSLVSLSIDMMDWALPVMPEKFPTTMDRCSAPFPPSLHIDPSLSEICLRSLITLMLLVLWLACKSLHIRCSTSLNWRCEKKIEWFSHAIKDETGTTLNSNNGTLLFSPHTLLFVPFSFVKVLFLQGIRLFSRRWPPLSLSISSLRVLT